MLTLFHFTNSEADQENQSQLQKLHPGEPTNAALNLEALYERKCKDNYSEITKS